MPEPDVVYTFPIQNQPPLTSETIKSLEFIWTIRPFPEAAAAGVSSLSPRHLRELADTASFKDTSSRATDLKKLENLISTDRLTDSIAP